MKHRKLSEGERSTGIALLFFIFCALLIGVSLLVKLTLVFLSAKFDGSHQVILEVQSAPTEASLVALSPDNQTASVLHISSSSGGDFGKYLGIPVDMKVTADPTLALSDLGQYILFHLNKKDTLNMIDRVRIFLYTSQLKATDISQKAITLNDHSGAFDSIIPELFNDHTLYSENVTIAIVNGTGVVGLGNAAARVVSDLGGNVISVSTGNITSVSSLVYHGQQSYTTKRLADIFHAKIHQTTSTMLSDIVITIGENDAAQFE